MTQPEKDKIYHFDDIAFEVRNAKDPIVKAAELSDYSYSFGASMNWLAYLLNFFFFLALIVLLGAVAFIFYYKSKTKKDNPLNNDINADDV